MQLCILFICININNSFCTNEMYEIYIDFAKYIFFVKLNVQRNFEYLMWWAHSKKRGPTSCQNM